MSLRGWVYLLSNRAMPGLLKIGFSTKDPALRLDELNGTGLPFPFVVEYDALVVDPREVERDVHLRLKHCHEAKEFFRIELSEAVNALRTVVTAQGKKIIAEQPTDFDSSCSFADLYPSEPHCAVCKTPIDRPGETRCRKCFALIP